MTPQIKLDTHQAFWGKHLHPHGGKNKPSMEQMIIQGREKWEKRTASIFRVEGCGSLVIDL